MASDKEKMQEWLERLRKNQEYIIVEGSNDKKALVALGINPNLIIIFGTAPYKLAEDLSKITKKVVLLVDLDKEGKKIYANLKENLNRVGVQVDHYFRRMLFKYSELSHIEGAFTYFRNLGLVE
ncbi:toprim domain-containing protein [Nanoarchaeota archaeon]